MTKQPWVLNQGAENEHHYLIHTRAMTGVNIRYYIKLEQSQYIFPKGA